MSKTAKKDAPSERAEALRAFMDRERARASEERAFAQARPPLSSMEAHMEVANAAGEETAAAFGPSFGTLGESKNAAADGKKVHEVVTEMPVAETSAESAKPIDAYWGSYGNADDIAMAQSGPTLEVVIGPDERVRVTNNEAYPWRAICSLEMVAQDGSRFIGTGWLVSERVVVTAGHCVFFHNNGGWAKSIDVSPGRDGSKRPFGTATTHRFRSVRGWTENRDRDFDYAAILLPETHRFGKQVGWFGYSARDEAQIRGSTLNISGYPGDKPSGTQWYDHRAAKNVSSTVITYEADTAGGQSGAPVWQLDRDGSRRAVGIHTNGSLSGNSATRINSEVFNNITGWIEMAP